jgi:hypothetical protein
MKSKEWTAAIRVGGSSGARAGCAGALGLARLGHKPGN